MYFLDDFLEDDEIINGLKEEIDKLRDIFNNGTYNDIDSLFFSIREKEGLLHMAEDKV